MNTKSSPSKNKFDAKLRIPLIIVFVLFIIFLIKAGTEQLAVSNDNICTKELAWGTGVIQTCTCNGKEVVVSNNLDVDGARITKCLGTITSKTCYTGKDIRSEIETESKQIPCSD